MNKQKLLPIILSAALFTGCFPSAEKSSANVENLSSVSSSETIISENGFPKVITDNSIENVHINAEVIIADGINANEPIFEYQIKRIEWDQEKVLESFNDGHNVTETKSFENTGPDDIMTNYYFDDGSVVSISNGTIRYDTALRKKYEYYYYLGDSGDYLTDAIKKLFPNDIIDGLDKADAQAQADKLINDFGISEIVSQPTVLSMDTETILKIQEKEQLLDKYGNAVEKWNEEADAFCFIYSLEYDDLLVSQVGLTSKNGFSSQPSSVIIIIGREGIIGIDINNIYNVEKVEEKTICSVDTAINAVKEEYKDIIMLNETEITTINLLYLPSPIDENKLIPVWIVYGTEKSDEINSPVNFTIDAFTGEMLAVNGING